MFVCLFVCLFVSGSVSKVFDDNGSSFDVVVNLAAQTKYGCTDEVRLRS